MLSARLRLCVPSRLWLCGPSTDTPPEILGRFLAAACSRDLRSAVRFGEIMDEASGRACRTPGWLEHHFCCTIASPGSAWSDAVVMTPSGSFSPASRMTGPHWMPDDVKACCRHFLGHSGNRLQHCSFLLPYVLNSILVARCWAQSLKTVHIVNISSKERRATQAQSLFRFASASKPVEGDRLVRAPRGGPHRYRSVGGRRWLLVRVRLQYELLGDRHWLLRFQQHHRHRGA